MENLFSILPDDIRSDIEVLSKNIVICREWSDREINPWNKKVILAATEAYSEYIMRQFEGLNPCLYTTIAFTHGREVLKREKFQPFDTLPDVTERVSRRLGQYHTQHRVITFK